MKSDFLRIRSGNGNFGGEAGGGGGGYRRQQTFLATAPNGGGGVGGGSTIPPPFTHNNNNNSNNNNMNTSNTTNTTTASIATTSSSATNFLAKFHLGDPTSHITTSSTSSSSKRKNENNNNSNEEGGRVLLDAIIIEFLASFFVHVVVLMHWSEPTHVDPSDWTLQFLPAVAWGMVLLILRDQDLFFPDTTASITLVQWCLGAYHTWKSPIIRIVGQLLGATAAVGLATLNTVRLPDYTENEHTGRLGLFFLNFAATTLEHLACIYIVLPLLPITNSHIKVVSSSASLKEENRAAPSTERISMAAFAFACVHWLLWKTFNSEMIPTITVSVGFMRSYTGADSVSASHAWELVGFCVLGQIVGVVCALGYALFLIPKAEIAGVEPSSRMSIEKGIISANY